MLTLVGAGGIGKTSLAVQLARRVEDRFPGGVWWLELAPLRDPDAMVAVMASAIGARAELGVSLLEAVLASLEPGPSLVLVDNCEHLVDAASELARMLLSLSSSVTVVATSRVPLHLREEHVWAVAPLGYEGDGSDAVRLFMERARQVRHDFAADEVSIESAGRICALVDGMPLAVELAAARCRSMSPADVLDRLERDAGRVLRDVRRDGQERQRTLAATIEWSHQLLSAQEQQLFAALSVFAGSFDLAAAETVCAGAGIDELDVADLLDGLIDQSMVTMADQSALKTARYRLLEPVRQFAEGLVRDREALAEQHGLYYAQLAEIGYEAMWTDQEAEWIRRFEADFDNHRVAYQFWADRGGITEALSIAIALNQVGELALQRPAGAEVLFSALNIDGVQTNELGPVAMAHAAAAMARRQDDRAIVLAKEAIGLAAIPDGRWEATLWASAAAMMLGDVKRATAGIAMALEAVGEVTSARARSIAYSWDASGAVLRGDLQAAADTLDSVPTTAPSSLLQANLIVGHVQLAGSTGDYQRALDLALDTAQRARANGNRWAAGHATLTAAYAATEVFDASGLLRILADVIPEWRQANDVGRLGGSFPYIAHGLAALGDNEFAAKLLGANTPHSVSRVNPRDQQLRERLSTDIRLQIGEEAFERLQHEGHATPVRNLAKEALQHIDRHTSN